MGAGIRDPDSRPSRGPLPLMLGGVQPVEGFAEPAVDHGVREQLSAPGV